MPTTLYIGLLLLLLSGIFCLTTFLQAYRKLMQGVSKRKKSAIDLRPKSLFDFFAHPEAIRFFTLATLNILRLFFASIAILFLHHLELFPFIQEVNSLIGSTLAIILLICLFLFPGDLIPRALANKKPSTMINTTSWGTSAFILILLPLTYPLYLFTAHFGNQTLAPKLTEPELRVKQELVDIIHEAETGTQLAPADKDLIESVVSFPNRIAREVMVPRVNIFSLPAKTTIKDAAEKCIEEGYSRVPVYRSSVDEIIGVLMYKDLLLKYMEFGLNPEKPEILERTIESIVKKTLYTPETKKISNLLQEFRKKQQHMAIVVDEYGGTEGIVTIEDILEEIVGEIADEYDEDQELYTSLTGGSWIIDTRMSILDIEEELDIKIPQEGEYDTISGYIYHRTGTIPPRGFMIDHDEFRIDIIKSGERGVEKVRLTPKEKNDT
jgi:putative hemolysin